VPWKPCPDTKHDSIYSMNPFDKLRAGFPGHGH